MSLLAERGSNILCQPMKFQFLQLVWQRQNESKSTCLANSKPQYFSMDSGELPL